MFSERLKKLRKQAGYSRMELAVKLGLSVSSISNYENNIRKPDNDETWRKIAYIFDVSVDYLMGEDISKLSRDEIEKLLKKGLISDNDIENNSYTSQNFTDDNLNDDNTDSDIIEQDTVEIPIYGDVAAGIGCFADDNIIGYEDIPQSWVNPYDQYILLRVKGDSMFPKFEEDDLLLVKAQNSVDSGDYAVALIDDENGVVKRIMYGKNWIELISVNPAYPPRRFEGADVMRIRIVGIVKKSIRDI